MDHETATLLLCIEGSQAEFAGRPEVAGALYTRAWQLATDDYEACIAAHYMARFQETPQATLRWNQVALERADAVGDERVQPFYPSLYLNMGHAYEEVGDRAAADHYYALAAALGFPHRAD